MQADGGLAYRREGPGFGRYLVETYAEHQGHV
jgi:hypothetical protein